MDYQAWLKAFAVELSQQWKGIGVDDLDPLHVQSLYHKDLSPSEAASLMPVLKEVSTPTQAAKAPINLSWTYLFCVVALILGVGIAFRMRRVIGSPSEAGQGSASMPKAASYAGGYPSQSINYASYGGFQPFFTHSMPYHARPADSVQWQGPPSQAQQEDEGLTLGSGGGSGKPGKDNSDITLDLPQSTTPRTFRTTIPATGGGMAGQQVPVIQQFQVTSQDQTEQGFSGQITWQVTNADEVEILISETAIPGVSTLQGSIPFTNLAAGTILTLRASKSGHTVEQSANVDSVQGY